MKEKPEEDPCREVIGLFAEIVLHLVQKLDYIVDSTPNRQEGARETKADDCAVYNAEIQGWILEINKEFISLPGTWSSIHGGSDEGGPAGPRWALALDQSGT